MSRVRTEDSTKNATALPKSTRLCASSCAWTVTQSYSAADRQRNVATSIDLVASVSSLCSPSLTGEGLRRFGEHR